MNSPATCDDLRDLLRETITWRARYAVRVAREAGIAQQTVSNFLRGKDVRGSTLLKLLNWLCTEWNKPHVLPQKGE